MNINKLLASQVPLSCISSTSPSTLVNLLTSMDTGNMDGFKKSFIATKIANSNDKALIKSMLLAATDSSFINSITTNMMSSLGIDVSNIPAIKLPLAYVYLTKK